MTRKELLDSIKPLSWIDRGVSTIGSLESKRAGVDYIIDKSYKGNVRLTLIDFRGHSYTECDNVEKAIQRANDIMKDKILQYFNIEEEI